VVKMVASMLLLLTPAFAFYFVAPVQPAHQPVVIPRSQPQMLLPQTGFLAPQTAVMDAHLPAIYQTTEILAKSKTDETLDDLFAAFPVFFTGLVLGGFVLISAGKAVKDILPEDLEIPEYAALAFIPLFSFTFVAAAKTGLLGAFAGAFAKAGLDAWNVFAQVALPGALLKY